MASVATPLIASLDAFYAVWKCTRELESASLVLGAGEEEVHPYLTMLLVLHHCCTHISHTTVSSRPPWPPKAQPYLDDLVHH